MFEYSDVLAKICFYGKPCVYDMMIVKILNFPVNYIMDF